MAEDTTTSSEETQETQEETFDAAAVASQLIEDLTTQEVETPEAVEETDDTSKDVKGKVESSETDLQDLLDDLGYESLDDLKEDLQDSESIKKKLKGRTLDEVIEAADSTSEVDDWEDDDNTDLDKDDDDDLNKTIRAKDREIRKLKAKIAEDYETSRSQQEETRIMKRYGDNVRKLVDDYDIPDAIRDQVEEIFLDQMGVDNPINDAQIEDGRQVRRIGVKKLKRLLDTIQTLSEAKIEDKREKRNKIPKVPPVKGTAPEVPKIKSIKHATQVMKEVVKKMP